MSERYKVIDSSQPNFITLTVIDWVDLFVRPDYCKVLDDALNYCIENKGVVVSAYVYMSSHIHLIVSSHDMKIPDFVRAFKSYTTKELIKLIDSPKESRQQGLIAKFSYAANRIVRGGDFKIWKDGYHPVLLDLPNKITQRVDYIHKNPVDAQIVHHERDYVNSSYRVYEDENDKVYIKVVPLY
jgi:REP element-mobilizing transposase RayT